jgi:FKBP-type peptidyl-prolyl cis-trans isomerase FkpA
VGYLRKGGKAKLIAPSHLAYDSVGVPQVLEPYTTLVYNVEMIDILTLEQVERERMQKAQAEEVKRDQARLNEPNLIRQYLREQQYNVEPLPSGLYYIELEKGTGPKAEQGSNVEVHYTLYNIQGRQLQSSKEFGEPFKLTVGIGQVIKGWDEGLQLMHQGGKARFVIPSDLAYGSTDRGPDIPPYSPLVFDVEMISVSTE